LHTVRTESSTHQPLSGGAIFAMALCCGLAVANLYYNQPMLGIIERDFPDSHLAGALPTATQIGYALGLLLLVPLGDIVNRRFLIVAQFGILCGALTFCALAPNIGTLILGSFVIGFCATAAQQIVPFAATLAPSATRGSTIGKIMSGLLCGMLLSRALAGVIGEDFGWREMYWLGVPLAALAATLMRIYLPRIKPQSDLPYSKLLRSLLHFWGHEPELRRATLTQAALFGAFSVFWTVLVFFLEGPRHRLGADVAGSFGLIGLSGMLAAPLAGYLADKRGAGMGVCIGCVLTLGSWIVFAALPSIPGLVVGTVLLDFGVQGALVSHQQAIFWIQENAQGRINTLFMTGRFVGGAMGSAGAVIAWHSGGWLATCGYGAVMALLALAFHGLPGPRPSPSTRPTSST